MASTLNASNSGAGGLISTADASGVLQLQTASTTAVTIDASQNVGIGTTSPFSAAGYKSLTINGSTTGVLAIQANGSNSCYLYSDGSAFNIKGVQNIPMDFYTNDTQRMRIDSGGAVMIGTTGLDGRFRVEQSATVWARATNHTNAGTQYFDSFRYNANAIGSITGNNTATAYNTSSDYRLKENIVPMTGALDTVAKLKPCTYTWKLDGSDGQGFIAHELQAIVPNAVTGEKDAVETYTDEEGVEQTRPKYQGVDTSFLVATLTAAIQEQQTIINDLKARIETLEGVK